MRKFARLYNELDATGSTNEKIDALKRYFLQASPADAAWAIFFLSGYRIKSLIRSSFLKLWAAQAAQLPDWLFEECYDAVGDLGEVIALILPETNNSSDLPLSYWIEERLLKLPEQSEAEQHASILGAWDAMDTSQRFVWNKLLTGSFRVGVSKQLVIRALALVSGADRDAIAQRLSGNWWPSAQFYEYLISADTRDTDISRPYPFFLAHAFDADPHELGDFGAWQIEWKWDGIRAQLINRQGQTFLWSRGGELINEQFPELIEAASALPSGTVIDGEIMPWKDGRALPFASLQRRLGRKLVSKKIVEEFPAALIAYDLLEIGAQDIRQLQMVERRAHLAKLLDTQQASHLIISPLVEAKNWEELAEQRQQSRAKQVEGVMLKRRDSIYGVGRQRGPWWKWKIEPHTIDAVMIYAQRGHGKRASLYTDYTFGIWDNGELVPIAKAYSGLTDEEIRQVDSFVRRNTIEKFGPVRAVKPELVFELAFEGIQRSTRHKCGIAVRFPRISRWRTDKTVDQADTLDTVKSMLNEVTV